jgi:NADH-quinone oxidoreductase subunit C
MAEQNPQQKIAQIVQDEFAEDILSLKEVLGETIVTLKKDSKDRLLEIGRFLHDNKELDFDFLSLVTAVDYSRFPQYPDHDCRFELVYQFFSVRKAHHLRLKIPLEEVEGRLRVDSLTPIWRSAEFHENEVYDMFGVEFNGHPELRRMYMPEDWRGHPLRKDYDLRQGQEYGTRKIRELSQRVELQTEEDG